MPSPSAARLADPALRSRHLTPRRPFAELRLEDISPRLPTGSHDHLRLVAPQDVPPGAHVLGVVIAAASDTPTSHAPTPPPAARQPLRLHLVPEGTPRGGPAQSRGIHEADDTVDILPGLSLSPSRRWVLREDRPVELTRQEFNLLEYLSTAPRRVLSRGQLLEAVWDVPAADWASTRTVDVHVHRLRHKLGPAFSRALQTVRGIGYRWNP